MAQEFAEGFYHSHQWRSTRKAYMERPLDTPWGICPPGACEDCFERGEINAAVIVHHKIWLNENNINDTTVTLNFKNLKRVCRECHAMEHGAAPPPRVGFDEHGNLIRRSDG